MMLRAALLLLALLCPPVSALTLDRVEPANWWVGMKHPRLQLMIHGDGIGAATPSLAPYPGVQLAGVRRTDNPNYLFLELAIGPEARAGQLELGFSLDGESLQHGYPLLAREPGSAGRQGFGPRDVIYLITPDRFANGDPGNDRVQGYDDLPDRQAPGGRHGGDLQGVIDHLDHLAALGVTQLWLNPVLENAMASYSYHGYAITDFYRVDPRFGSNGLYRQLADQARQRGLGLIMDVVLNHVGTGHWWLADLPASDWLHPAGLTTNHRRETLVDPHAVAADREAFGNGWFVPTMADLNQANPLLAEYLIQNAIWWLETLGLSGLRIDTWSYSDQAFLASWSRRLLAEYPNLNLVGEEWVTVPALVAYWQKGKANHDGYGTELPSLMDFPLQEALVGALTEPESWRSGLIGLYQVLAQDFLYPAPHNLVIFADNHDMSRIASQLGEDPRLWRMAMAVLATTRGIPQLFYGTELMMANPGGEDHGLIRSDFPGGWPGDQANAFSGSGLTPQQVAAQGWLKRLLNWRKGATAIHDGSLVHHVPHDGLYVYFRRHEAQNVMVILNKNETPKTVELARFAAQLQGAGRALEVTTGRRLALEDSLTLPAKTAWILELEP
ncbi:glycoside hydrolase family 13 protein [Gallaecimonas sp. GXIMD4217]|uniref:glycoside hydrolase family 13 protein n=1 Tax=Gallaecimonas sp. GXIMD4217 TaxID=3131927 RepID=UPI00311AE69F